VTRAIYVIGAPGVGKSTATWGAFPAAPGAPFWSPEGYPMVKLTGCQGGVLQLGKYRPAFPGTDALGMAVVTQATSWVANTPPNELPSVLVGEGARLANLRFLGALHRRGDVYLTVVHLTAADRSLATRRSGRTQNASWVKGATTRAYNLAAELRTQGFEVMAWDTTDADPLYAVDALKRAVDW